MTTEQKARAYDKAIEAMEDCIPDKDGYVTVRPCDIFPELQESEDERIRKLTIHYLDRAYQNCKFDEYKKEIEKCIAWLEKKGDTNETINKDEFAQGVLKGAAINLITWIDYNAAEGNMCLSNTECKDIEDSLVNGDWNKIYAYIKNKLEKQGEQKSIDDLTQQEAMDIAVAKCFGQGEQKASYTTIVETGNGGINALVTKELPTDGCYDEQKPTDKVEPKFKVGDWITNGEYTWFIEGMHNSFYDIISPEGCGTGDTIIHVDEHFHLWTLTDAKDGDVLVYSNSSVEIILLFKKWMNGVGDGAYSYAHTFNNEILFNDWSDCGYGTRPATKEQRDHLFEKMKEAGYEWDEEKRELKKIEKQGDNPADVGLAELGKIWEEEHLQVDDFDAELNALLKKYEHLQKYEIIGCLNFYIKAVEKTENDDNTKRH